VAHAAVVTFTSRSVEEILHDQGSRNWRLDAGRAREAEYLVCTQNQRNRAFRTPNAPHRAAFLIGLIADVVASSERPDRWLIKISEYVVLDPPVANIWGKCGNLRYPVWYTTLETLGLDLARLPPFTPLPAMSAAPSGSVGASTIASEADAWGRMDAILAQLDRVPDLPSPTDPLEWDEHGLPR
jgi:hypothetical protein